MKNKILCFAIIFWATYAGAQIPTIQWQKTFGGTSQEGFRSVDEMPNGELFFTGYSSSVNGDVTQNQGATDFWVMKTNGTGDIVWQKSLGGGSADFGRKGIYTSDGGFIVVGYTMSTDGDVTGFHGGYGDIWVVKLNNNGIVQWEKALGGSSTDDANSVIQTSDGGYLIAGSTASNDGDVSGNHGLDDFWIVKLDVSGNLQWQKTYGGTGNDTANSLIQDNDGGYVVAGLTGSNDGDVSGNHGPVSTGDAWVIKLDVNGNLLWQKCFGGSLGDGATDIKKTTNGGYIVVAFSNSSDGEVGQNLGSPDYWLIKLDASANIVWSNVMGGSNFDWPYSVSQTLDGGYFISGYSSSNDDDVTGNYGSTDCWVVKTNPLGEISWQKNYGGSNSDWGIYSKELSNGAIIIVGDGGSNDNDLISNYGSVDGWVIKLNAEILNVNEISKASIKIYPNPVESTLNISNTATQNLKSICIYNQLGQNVYTSSANSLTSNIDVSMLPTGSYYINIETDKGITVSKFLKK